MTITLTLAVEEVAQLVGGGVSTRSIWRWVEAGTFPKPIKMGSRSIWRRRDVELFVEAGGIHAYRRAKRGE